MLRNALLSPQRIDAPCVRKLTAYCTIGAIANGKTSPYLFIKIALFTAAMLIVARGVSYDGLVNSITGLFGSQSASKFIRFISGAPDVDVWES